ncbi:hypothetical protein TWF594_006655 [Orbilia oligospora]|nr:hypothetical protein TWF594_006655 [Orbilia oligospora]
MSSHITVNFPRMSEVTSLGSSIISGEPALVDFDAKNSWTPCTRHSPFVVTRSVFQLGKPGTLPIATTQKSPNQKILWMAEQKAKDLSLVQQTCTCSQRDLVPSEGLILVTLNKPRSHRHGTSRTEISK